MAQFVRLGETHRRSLTITVDGVSVPSLEGDTIMTALLTNGRRVRESASGHGPRAGFCLMGACQDCWVWLENGDHVPACSTVVTEGMQVRTRSPQMS